jgi:AraC-like DNA-binding protein
MSSGAAEPQLLHFSTDRLPETDRIGVWREVYGQTILRLDIEHLPDWSFQADIRLRAIPGLRVVSGTISGARDQRTRALMVDGNDDFGMAINWGGTISVLQCGREAMLNDGDAILMSCSDAGTVTRPSPCRYVGLRVPRSILAALVPNCEDLLGVPIPRGTPALRLLGSYATTLLPDDGVLDGPERQHVVVSHIYDLLALTLGATGEVAALAERRGASVARLRSIRADIAKHLGSRKLTIDFIASRHGVSPRYIQRLFESEDMSFTDFVLRQRLARAYRLLSDPRQCERKISSIAFDVGFGDLSYFNRCFRRLYGMTPSDARAATL